MNESSVSITTGYKDEGTSGANTIDKKKVIDIHSHPDKDGTKGGSATDMDGAIRF